MTPTMPVRNLPETDAAKGSQIPKRKQPHSIQDATSVAIHIGPPNLRYEGFDCE